MAFLLYLLQINIALSLLYLCYKVLFSQNTFFGLEGSYSSVSCYSPRPTRGTTFPTSTLLFRPICKLHFQKYFTAWEKQSPRKPLTYTR